jgi:hypothetical protein
VLPRSGGVRRRGLGIGAGRIEVLARDREEDLVEAGSAEADVVDFDASFVEKANDVAQLITASLDASRDSLTVDVGVRRLAPDLREGLLDRGEVTT